MRPNPKTQLPPNLKFIIFSFLSLSIILLVIRSNTSHASRQTSPQKFQTRISNSTIHSEKRQSETSSSSTPVCTKAPHSLASALIHYATTNITPQQTQKEISVTQNILARKSPCNFLVFGLGYDSLMWAALNHGGRTVFLEENENWIREIKQKFPTLESYHVHYPTKVHQADKLIKLGTSSECKMVTDPRSSQCELALKGFPTEVYEVQWDVIMVDAPTGYHDEAPGRMGAIYTAGLMGRNKGKGKTEVMVHDVDRKVEDGFSKVFLCEEYLKEQEGRLRRFTIPSHRSGDATPFCP